MTIQTIQLFIKRLIFFIAYARSLFLQLDFFNNLRDRRDVD